jgi:exosortase/archaeosortase family protein
MIVLDSAGFWLRMWVVDASAAISHGLGIGVIKNGTQLLAPDGSYDYDVAAACSGVRSLTALGALSLLIGYLRFRPWLVRAGLFAVSAPFILIGNIARVVAIIVAARLGGTLWGDRIHEVMGYGVFAIVLGGVLGIAELLTRRRPAWVAEIPDSDPAGFPTSPQSDGSSVGRIQVWAGASLVVLATLLATAFLVHVSNSVERGSSGVALDADGKSPVELPSFIGTEWIGRREAVTEVERQILPPDTGFSRKTYVSLEDPSKQVFLSIVLSGRDRTSIHRPEICLVGQGWTIRESFPHEFLYGKSGRIPARVLRVEKDVSTPAGRVRIRQIVAYYFVGGDVVVADHWDRMARDVWNRVVHGRADRWAYILLQTGASDGAEAALGRIQEILDATLPTFQPRR